MALKSVTIKLELEAVEETQDAPSAQEWRELAQDQLEALGEVYVHRVTLVDAE